MRGKSQVQFADKERWSCVKASRIFYVCGSTYAWHVMPNVSTQVYMLDCKIWKALRPRGNERENTKCDQFFCPPSDFFDFARYHVPLPMMHINFCRQKGLSYGIYEAYAEICICDHSLFTLQFHFIEKLGTNVATTSWLNWSQVSWHIYIRPSQMAARGPDPARRPYMFGPLSTPKYTEIPSEPSEIVVSRASPCMSLTMLQRMHARAQIY